MTQSSTSLPTGGTSPLGGKVASGRNVPSPAGPPGANKRLTCSASTLLASCSDAKLVRRKRLEQEAGRTGAQGIDRRFHTAVASDHDARDIGIQVLDGAEQLDAVQARHHDVGEDEVERFSNREVDGLVRALGAPDEIPRPRQTRSGGIDDRTFIVDKKDAFLGAIRQGVPPSLQREAAKP